MPVPSESVVYGSGETAVVLSKVHFAAGHYESLAIFCVLLKGL